MDIEIAPIAIPRELFVDEVGNRLNTTGDLCAPMFLSSDIITAITNTNSATINIAPTIHQQGVLVLSGETAPSGVLTPSGIYWPEMVVYEVLYAHIYAGNFDAWRLFEWIAERVMFARNVVATDAKRLKPEVSIALNKCNKKTRDTLKKMRSYSSCGGDSDNTSNISDLTNKIEHMQI